MGGIKTIVEEKKESKRTMKIHIELVGFDEAEKKVKQLVELLREAKELTASLEKE